jgi:4a-hydroxytetrahydrobiopterin dehydratase
MSDYLKQQCHPQPAGSPAMDEAALAVGLAEVEGWAVVDGRLVRKFDFKNFHQTMEFVNALAWIVHREDHHPELQVSYKNCRVAFSTHSIGGISENDFICAAKINALIS